MKNVHFVSLGCPKNLVDSEIMLGTLLENEFNVVDDPNKAETIIVNTCGFIDEAKKESISKILEMSEYKKEGKLKNLVMAGCLTQRYKDELVKEFPEVDFFIGSGSFQDVAKILNNSDNKKDQIKKSYFNLPTYLQQENTPRKNSQPAHRAYLKISEGCKKRCAFCAIPLIRGNLQSRRIESIVSEAKLLVAGGVKELIVVSHDFTDYGWDLKRKDPSLNISNYELLKALSENSGAEWIRLLYLYPDGLKPETIQLIKEKDNIVKYIDMPLQHINNAILKRMNRRITREEITECLSNLRAEIPDAVIRTQFIVGYPGETEDSFNELVAFIQEQKFDRVGCFKYSKEENTKAAQLDQQVDEQTKERRWQTIMEVQKSISRRKHKMHIGKIMKVIVEGFSEETDLLLVGRNSQQAPDIDGVTYINSGSAKVGEIVNIKITDSHDYDLVGEIH